MIRGALSASEETFEDTIKGAIVQPSGEDEATDNKRRDIAKYFREENIAVSEIPFVANRKLLKDIEIKKNVEYWNAISVLSQSLKNFPSKMTLRRNYVDGKALVKIASILIEMMNKNSWFDFSDNYLMGEKYLCDKNFQIYISPTLELKTVYQIEQRKEYVLKEFRYACPLTQEVNEANNQLERLISSINDKEEKARRLKVAEEARRKAEMEREVAEKARKEKEKDAQKAKLEKERLEVERRRKQKEKKKDIVKTVLGGIGAIFAFSDARLKENVIILTPSKYEVLGVRQVRWTWNKEAEKMGLRGEARGVIAQEVEKLYPWAVVTGTDGYKRVLYKALDYAVDSLQAKRKEDRESS